jgi:hypothetical protein
MLSAVKARIDQLKEHRDRVAKAVKSAERFQERLKGYVKFVMQTFPDVPYKGTSGRLALQNNPESLKIDFETKDVTFYKAIDRALVGLEPSLNTYIREVVVCILDNDKIKADLKGGVEIPWARFERDQHVRIRT